MKKEFLDFLKQYGVIGMAIAVIIGGKLNELVTSLVNDLLMPVVFGPVLRATQVDDVRKLNLNGIFYGKLLGAGIDFLLVAVVIFYLVKLLLKDAALLKK